MRCLILAAAIATPAFADDWSALKGADIASALTVRQLDYGDAVQRFYASGRTLYDNGQPSWGRWIVRGDQYCSLWPPSDVWSCYAVDASAASVRFTGAGGHVSVGVYAD